MTTDAWQQTYEADGYVDLWVQEEFNSGSRLVVCLLAPSAGHTVTSYLDAGMHAAVALCAALCGVYWPYLPDA